jgi:hypothetical protein
MLPLRKRELHRACSISRPIWWVRRWRWTDEAGDYTAWGKGRKDTEHADQPKIEQPLRYAGQYEPSNFKRAELTQSGIRRGARTSRPVA